MIKTITSVVMKLSRRFVNDWGADSGLLIFLIGYISDRHDIPCNIAIEICVTRQEGYCLDFLRESKLVLLIYP
jgi:hypothetical protein